MLTKFVRIQPRIVALSLSLVIAACMVTPTRNAWTVESAGSGLEIAGIQMGASKASVSESLNSETNQAFECADLRVAHATLRKRVFIDLCQSDASGYVLNGVAVSHMRYIFVDATLVRMDIQAPLSGDAEAAWGQAIEQQDLEAWAPGPLDDKKLTIHQSGKQGDSSIILAKLAPGFNSLAGTLLARDQSVGAGGKLRPDDAAQLRKSVASAGLVEPHWRMTLLQTSAAAELPMLKRPEF